MTAKYTYTYLNKDYEVIIEHKSMCQRNIHFRLRNDVFYISAPYMVKNNYIMSLLENKYGPRLIKSKKDIIPIGEGFNYIFGVKNIFNIPGKVSFSNGEEIIYDSLEDFENKMKKMFLDVLTQRVRHYESIMGLSNHTVKVRRMTSRYGSNAKRTKSVTFALNLYHYSFEIIDAIIIHELAHSIVFNHSKSFYDVVYKYCPNYKELHKKLRKGVFK